MRETCLSEDPMFVLLTEGMVDEFNKRKAAGETCDLSNCDFRGCDLRNMDASGLDMSNCYFRQSDLRGIDFTQTRLEGASFASAKVSGTYFPSQISAQEMLLSVEHGTRVRYS